MLIGAFLNKNMIFAVINSEMLHVTTLGDEEFDIVFRVFGSLSSIFLLLAKNSINTSEIGF